MALKVANTVVALVYVIPLCGFLTTFSLFYAGVNNNTMNQQMNLSHQAIGAGLVPEYAISFLSDTINFYPTSNIGAMFISIAAFFFLLTFFIRHIEVNKKAAERLRGPLAGKRANVRRIQIAAAVLGACSGFGAVGVAAFQEHINIVVHLAMAGLFFLLGTLYCCLQTAIDLIMKLESKRVRLTRLLVCSFMIISTIVLVAPKPGVEKAIANQLSAGFEILTFILYMVFFATYHVNFRHLDISLAMDDVREVGIDAHQMKETPLHVESEPLSPTTVKMTGYHQV
eukprot:CAMPEP_0113867804 /NCGR_PEP_ID=MMETSP0780_2-20120614/626_1 /TAXON_ID=652834 /ORGANISM="Palpitomonas bilix" /LENGTH=283 /DNA_ID=CAMNT_0000852795 /DNA_START=102 /DNA_END=953 /DNA_ORIENTATION=+ /assembly_acc=CAM_ASM_000599